ncbi:hypothetical protein E4T56_gene1455 [Termitomyces sp. T112]|nr:hypothetical protein E4T56_gene1455 [Termitomyces sp. T112]
MENNHTSPHNGTHTRQPPSTPLLPLLHHPPPPYHPPPKAQQGSGPRGSGSPGEVPAAAGKTSELARGPSELAENVSELAGVGMECWGSSMKHQGGVLGEQGVKTLEMRGAGWGLAGVSHSLSYPGCGLGMGIKFSGAPTFDHRGLPLQASGGANGSADVAGGGALTDEGGSRCSVGGEGGIGVGVEHLSAGGAGASAGGTGLAGVSNTAGVVAHGGGGGAGNGTGGWSAIGRMGILRPGWVWEHQVLLDSASMAFASIQDGLAQMPMGQPLELQQGMARVGRLLAGHRQHNVVALGLWWEVAVDAGEALLELAEVLVVVWAQMEIDLGVGMVGVLGEE